MQIPRLCGKLLYPVEPPPWPLLFVFDLSLCVEGFHNVTVTLTYHF